MRKKNNSEALASAIIDGKGSVYVCGGTSMGTAVMEAVKDALELRLKDRAQAEKYVANAWRRVQSMHVVEAVVECMCQARRGKPATPAIPRPHTPSPRSPEATLLVREGGHCPTTSITRHRRRARVSGAGAATSSCAHERPGKPRSIDSAVELGPEELSEPLVGAGTRAAEQRRAPERRPRAVAADSRPERGDLVRRQRA